MFTFGSDPEFIVLDKNKRPRSAIGVVNGTKKRRIVRGECGFYWDNVLAECTVQPAHNKAEAISNIGFALKQYADIVKPHQLTIRASQNFPDEELETGPMLKCQDGTMVRAGRFAGCKTEFCAYSLGTIEPDGIQDRFKGTNLRTAGGHVHLGTELGQTWNACVSLVRMLDLFLGLPSLLIDKSQGSVERRQLYGEAGRFRQPPHGCEYRTLSNFWLVSPATVELVYDLCEFAVAFVKEENHKEFWSIDEDRLKDDDFWNNDGDPANLHVCQGYDIAKLRGLFREDDGEYDEFMRLLEKHMPKPLMRSIYDQAAKYPTYDLAKEWAL
jgi:hypothetical protein